MFRLGGKGTEKELKVPMGAPVDPSSGLEAQDLGVLACEFFELADSLCREVEHDAVELYMKGSKQHVDALLDPLPSNDDVRAQRSGDAVVCNGLLDNYITSSILDCFRYGTVTPDESAPAIDGERHAHAHNSHTDSGISCLFRILVILVFIAFCF